MKLATLQEQFMASLCHQPSIIASEIVDQGNISCEIRLGIYQNAYRIRLKETLQTDHPILGLYLGDALFDEMAEGYIDHCPSESYTLRQFADLLPHYLSKHSPFQEHPTISELATFERRLMDAFDAADAERATLDALMQRPANQWPELHFRFHPSLQLFPSQWRAVECWQALKQDEPPPQVSPNDKPSPQQWLLWRNHERITEFKCLSELETELIQQALAGDCFAQLCDTILDTIDESEALAYAIETIQQWIGSGLITTLTATKMTHAHAQGAHAPSHLTLTH